MTFLTTRQGFALSATAGLVTLSVCLPAALASQSRPPLNADALQVVADVVLIEAECRQLNVDYGRLFAYAERNGLRTVDVMPTGDRRAAFEAAYHRRAREMTGDRLCSELAAERDATVPGVLMPR